MLEWFLAREPSIEERLELFGARFAAQYFNFNAAPNSVRLMTEHFLPFRRVWDTEEIVFDSSRYSTTDRQLLAALGH